MTSLLFRTAVEADVERLIEIHTSAFPDPRGNGPRRTNFIANPRGELSTLHVAVEADEIVAHAFLFPLRGWFAGGTASVGAIASVAVAPEARGRGIAAALLGHLHERADAAKSALTMLYAFRQGFYAKHGYAAVTPNRRLSIHPASIPASWRADAATHGITLRTVRANPSAPAADRTAIVNAYVRAAGRGHGWLVRPTGVWEHVFADERRVWVVATHGTQARRVAGYVCWSLLQSQAHASTRLLVNELVADDDVTRRVLLGAIGAQRDQVTEVDLELDARDPLDRALLDSDRARFGTEEVEHHLGTLTGGPMVRLVDVARALTARTYASDGALDLVIGERPPLHLAVSEGKGKLSVPRQARAPLAIDRAALGAVLFGGLSASDAARLGWAGGDPHVLARADAIFASPPFFALDAY